MWPIVGLVLAIAGICLLAALADRPRQRRARDVIREEYPQLGHDAFCEHCAIWLPEQRAIAIQLRNLLAGMASVSSNAVHPDIKLAEFYATQFDFGEPVELANEIEKELGVEISNDDIQSIQTMSTIGALLPFVLRKVNCA